MTPLYTATAHATGDGRNGHTRSDDGILDLDVRIPKEMGGAGGATNPEQLFAAGYAACFHSALKFVAAQDKPDVTDTEVSASSHRPSPSVASPQRRARRHAPTSTAPRRARVGQAHQVCPTRIPHAATRGNLPWSAVQC